MGPGYFPLLLGVLLAILGVVVIFKAMVVETDGRRQDGQFRLEAAVLHHPVANLSFGILLGGLPRLSARHADRRAARHRPAGHDRHAAADHLRTCRPTPR
jgi:hypothetical protein